MIVRLVGTVFGIAHHFHAVTAAGVGKIHPLLQRHFEPVGLVVVAQRDADLVGESGIAVGGGEREVGLQAGHGGTPVNVI